MKKIYRKLTQDQIDRGVVFSSTLSKMKIEQPGDTIHEVTKDTYDKDRHIANLKDDSFFNDSSWKYNIIRN